MFYHPQSQYLTLQAYICSLKMIWACTMPTTLLVLKQQIKLLIYYAFLNNHSLHCLSKKAALQGLRCFRER